MNSYWVYIFFYSKMSSLAFFQTLAARDTTSVYNGFATIRAESGFEFLSISISTAKQIKEIRKFFQIQQTPEFRFVSIEPTLSCTISGVEVFFTNRFQIRFRKCTFS